MSWIRNLALAAAIGGGDVTVESLSVTANGTYTAPTGKAYSPVVADVPNTYVAADEGKVVSSGALVAQTARASEITANGTYDTTVNNSVTVNVSGGGGGDVEPTLPAEYQEVEYMDFDGNSYATISSRFIQAGDVIETCMMWTDANTSEQAAIGTDASSGSRIEFFFNSNKISMYAGQSTTARGGVTRFINIQVGGGNDVAKTDANQNEKYYAMMIVDKYESENHLRIGMYGTSYKYRSRLYKIKVSHNTITLGNASSGSFASFTNTPVAWYKPCYRKSDNVPGWYDTSTDTFYTNEGSGAFAVGPDVA